MTCTTSPALRETNLHPRPRPASLTPADRDRLVQEHLWLVEVQAHRVAERIFDHAVEIEELISDGYLGLLDAARKFDPARHVKFATYAALRIRGAMIDGHREREPAPRQTLDRLKHLDRLTGSFYAEHGRPPGDSEEDLAALAREANATVAELLRWMADVAETRPGREMGSLDFVAYEGGRGGVTLDGVVFDPDPARPGDAMEAREQWRQLSAWLTRTQRMVAELYYGHGCNMKETGAAIGFCESRACQILKEVRGMVRAEAVRAEAARVGRREGGAA